MLQQIEEATGIRRETASGYLKAAGIEVRGPRRRRRAANPANRGVDSEPASQVSSDFEAGAKPTSGVSTDSTSSVSRRSTPACAASPRGCAALSARTSAIRRSTRSTATCSRTTASWHCRVADLVAEGCTNQQIGKRLFLSADTAKTHLAHISTKLDVANRAEIAAEVVRRHARSR